MTVDEVVNLKSTSRFGWTVSTLTDKVYSIIKEMDYFKDQAISVNPAGLTDNDGIVTIKISDDISGTSASRRWHLQVYLSTPAGAGCVKMGLLKYGKKELLRSSNFDEIAKKIQEHNENLKLTNITRKLEQAKKNDDIATILIDRFRVKALALDLNFTVSDKYITISERRSSVRPCYQINITVTNTTMEVFYRLNELDHKLSIDFSDPHFDPEKIERFLEDITTKLGAFRDKMRDRYNSIDILEVFYGNKI